MLWQYEWRFMHPYIACFVSSDGCKVVLSSLVPFILQNSPLVRALRVTMWRLGRLVLQLHCYIAGFKWHGLPALQLVCKPSVAKNVWTQNSLIWQLHQVAW